MKKVVISLFLFVFCLCLSGCKTLVKNTTLSSIVKDETFNDAFVTSFGSDVRFTVEYNDLKEQEFYKNIMNSKVKSTDVLPDVIPSWGLIIKSDNNKIKIESLSDLYVEYNDKWYLIDCTKEDKIALHNYLLVGREPTYKLTVQNDTEMELIGIKCEYQYGKEVEVKMEYDMAVETFVYLNGKMIGELNGSNSVKFNMPNEDSVLTINYLESEMYKLTVIDNFGLINKKLYNYYFLEEMIIFTISHELYDQIEVTINGEVIEGRDPLLQNSANKMYIFKMPKNDSEIVVYVNGLSDYSCEDDLHHYDEKIKKVDATNLYIKESTCKRCGKVIQEEIAKIKLFTETIFMSYQSVGHLFEEFVSEFKLSNKKYLIIDSADAYFNVYPKIPSMNTELLTEENAEEFFKDNIIVLHIRYISGTLNSVPVNYYYNLEDKNITMEYINDMGGMDVTCVFLGNTIDLITIPKAYYNEIVK